MGGFIGFEGRLKELNRKEMIEKFKQEAQNEAFSELGIKSKVLTKEEISDYGIRGYIKPRRFHGFNIQTLSS